MIEVVESDEDLCTFTIYMHARLPFEMTAYTAEDARDIVFLVKTVMDETFRGFPFGQLCLHEGKVQKEGRSKTFANRYIRLFKSRLICYRSRGAKYPVNVVSLDSCRVSQVCIVPWLSDVHTCRGDNDDALL